MFTGLSGSLANYKNTYQPMSTIMNQALARNSDTGQVNWATIPTESSGVRDYEIFAFTGSLQATAPIFIRVDYQGGGSGSVHTTVGTTTDGAGNLGGLTVAKLAMNVVGVDSYMNNKMAYAASDGTSYWTFHYCLDPVASGADGMGAVVVERTRDNSGNATGDGFHVWRWQRNTNQFTTTFQGGFSRMFGVGPQPTVNYNCGINVPDPVNTNAAFVGLSAMAFPAYTYWTPKMLGASQALLFCYPNDFPRAKQVTVNHYGVPQSYVSLATAVPHLLPEMNSATGATTRTLSPMIRWD